MGGLSPSASPWSTGNSITRGASSTDWCGKLTEAAPADALTASAEAEPASSNTPADATILLSLPGIGTDVLATLLAERRGARRRRDYHALRCRCGVAPVTRRAGKSPLVVRRLAAHDRLRDAAYH